MSETLAALEIAVQTAPELASAHYNFANVLSHAGRLDDAIKSYRLALP